MPDPFVPRVRAAGLAELDPLTLYRILALRSDVFVVEQDCVYLDTDGRDTEADARQLWVEDAGGAVLATLRLLAEADGTARIGRVVTARSARDRGLAGVLMTRALELSVDRAVVLHAQSHLARWYARFGFVRDGEDFLEDGIPHLPMRRPAAG